MLAGGLPTGPGERGEEMICEALQSALVDMARGEPLDPRVALTVETHAAACRHCQARLSEERALSASLLALAGRTAQEEAPPRVESALRALFREAHSRKTRSWRVMTAWTAVAAAASLFATTAILRTGRPVSPPRPRLAVGAEATAGTSRAFVPLQFAEPLTGPGEATRIVRVELPSSTLVALGFRAAPDRGSVRADLVLADDGVARAIRFVR